MEETTVCLNIDIDDLGFLKSAIAQRAKYLIEYINDCESDHKLFLEEQEEEEEAQLDLLREQNEKLQKRLRRADAEFWKKPTDAEIQDIEMNEFQTELREMIAKHTPAKRGRPLGSKNKEKANAE
jgi:hypothetical protein